MSKSKLYFKRTDKHSIEIMEVFPVSNERIHILFNPHKKTTFKLSEDENKSWVNYETLNYIIILPLVNPRKRVIYPDLDDLGAIIDLAKISNSKLITFNLKPLERTIAEHLSKKYYDFLPFKDENIAINPLLINSPYTEKKSAIKRLISTQPTLFMQALNVKLKNYNLLVFEKALPVFNDQEIIFNTKLQEYDFLLSISILPEKEKQYFESNYSGLFISSDGIQEWSLLKDVF